MTKTLTPEEAAAREAAAAARQAVDAAERAITGGKRVSLDKLTTLVTRARHADLTATATHAQAEQDREQARQEALVVLGAEIDAMAAAGAEDLEQALADVADAVGRARRAAEGWDKHLAEVARAARDLDCSAPAPGGPREADQRVAVTRDGTVYHAENALKPVVGQMVAALQHAVDGDVVSALAVAEVKARTRIPARADHYLRGRRGMILPVVGDLTEHQRGQVRCGDLVELTESQVRSYLAGDELSLTKAQEHMYRAGR
jgi:hypothetical protein